jgi:ubiquinol-cytochrome c reductase cytochrome b subunit
MRLRRRDRTAAPPGQPDRTAAPESEPDRTAAEPPRGRMLTVRAFRWMDDRLGGASFARRSLTKVFPDHWSFMLGEVALYCFLILVLTGTFLTFFYHPDPSRVTYHGAYRPLDGRTMSRAYQSVLHLSFEVRSGLVFRQIHHWTALVMVGAVAAHAARVFFTGAFRKPRDVNWVFGVVLLLLTLGIGFTGYSLPDDLLSGTGLRIMYSVVVSIPVIGTWAAFLLFGGEYPAPDILSRLFVIHVMILPGAIAAVVSIHLAIVWHQKHTHFPGRGRTESNIQGERLWPGYALKSVGLLLSLIGILSLLAGLAQINPVWLYGPYNAHQVSIASQPDWYFGWLEGALRLYPNWELRGFGFEIPTLFFPGILMPGLLFGALFAWPWIERRITGDDAPHHLLNFPRDVPWRTALGAAALAFLVTATISGGNDFIAASLGISVNAMTETFRLLVILLPVATFAVTYWICNELSRRRLHPVRDAPVRVVRRTLDGGFEVDEDEAGPAGA